MSKKQTIKKAIGILLFFSVASTSCFTINSHLSKDFYNQSPTKTEDLLKEVMLIYQNATQYKPQVAYKETEKRIVQINDLLEQIEIEQMQPGTSILPEIVIISDFHGEIKGLLNYVADAIGKKMGREVTLYHSIFPDTSIEQQLLDQDIQIKNVGLIFYLLGDFLDRGAHGIKCFLASKELLDLGVAQYVTGNHDLWAFLNIMGFHLPTYKGFNFYGQEEGKKLVEQHWNDPEIVADRIGWWTKKLANYIEAQKQTQKATLHGKSGQVRSKYKNIFLGIQHKLKPEHKSVWEDLIGFYFGEADVYTGFRAVGMMSVAWWEDKVEKLEEMEAYLTNFAYPACPEQRRRIHELREYAVEALQTVKGNLERAVEEGKWWWVVFNDINHENYRSVEWWGKDWSSHKGWGTSVINEINELENTKKWNQSNYIHNDYLQQLALFYRKNFTLYVKDPYGNLYTHGWLPVNEETGNISFTYKGKRYSGIHIFEGMDIIQSDICDLEKPLSQLHEALSLVNSWYADKTTKIKPIHMSNYIHNIGLEKIYKHLGINCWLTCHNPLNKLIPKGIGFKVHQGNCLHFSVDKGMSWKKFKDVGGYVTVNANGIKLWGYGNHKFEGIIENPPTIKLETLDEGDHMVWGVLKRWENESLSRENSLKVMKLQLTQELERLTTLQPENLG